MCRGGQGILRRSWRIRRRRRDCWDGRLSGDCETRYRPLGIGCCGGERRKALTTKDTKVHEGKASQLKGFTKEKQWEMNWRGRGLRFWGRGRWAALFFRPC